MAQSQYATLCTGLNRSVDFDEVLRKILQNYGLKEWELVQVLQPRNDAFYHLVFKAERSLCPSLEPGKALHARDRWLQTREAWFCITHDSSCA